MILHSPHNIKLKTLLLFIALITINKAAAQRDMLKSKSPLTIGESIEIRSNILNEPRVLNVYLPAGYSTETDKRYPVIYLLDGAMDEDFLHVAGLVQFGSFPWIKMIPESIVVGISNTDRKRNFTFPTSNEQDKKDFPTSGKSHKFIDFIQKELLPYVNTAYRTAETSTVIGQSLGGLLVTEILFTKPGLFNNYIIVSPSLWWDNESLLKAKPAVFPSGKSIYIAVGKEGEVMERTAKELFAKLTAHGAEKNRLYFDFLDAQSHGDALHLAVYAAFEKIFRERP